MNVALWAVAGLLAVAYALSGGLKLAMPKAKMETFRPASKWVEDFSGPSVKAIGALEVLAAIGLILPAVLDTAPVLVPWAAVGLAVIMAGATVVRIRRREFDHMAVDLVYLGILVFVAWGRFGPESF
ncbi:DoxX family protein [Yinghuangia sp. YIM S09857]|uniref:DoxX family protein n=1 Tax=Yinghuangia sp. YIM S09857 TaxID=3436929 RepID=UPI003F52B1A7